LSVRHSCKLNNNDDVDDDDDDDKLIATKQYVVTVQKFVLLMSEVHCVDVLQCLTRNTDTVTPKKKSKASCTPKKLLTPKSSRLMAQSPGGPYAVRTTNFVHVASLQLTKTNLMKTNFSLDKVRCNS